jgi:hypothetical protein
MVQKEITRDHETALMVRMPPTREQTRRVEGIIMRIRDGAAPFAVAEDAVDEFGGRRLSTDWRIREVGAGSVSLERDSPGGMQRVSATFAEFAAWQRLWIARESAEVLGLCEGLKSRSEPVVVSAGDKTSSAPVWERGWLIESVDVPGRSVNLKRGGDTMRAPADGFIGWQMSWTLERSAGIAIAQMMMEEGLQAATVSQKAGKPVVTRGWTVHSVGMADNVELRRKWGDATGMWSLPADEFVRCQLIAEGEGAGPIRAEYDRLMGAAPRQAEVPEVVRELAGVADDALLGTVSALPQPMEPPGGKT